MSPNIERDLAIASARVAGQRWCDIAKDFGLSVCRIRQIVHKAARKGVIGVDEARLSPEMTAYYKNLIEFRALRELRAA